MLDKKYIFFHIKSETNSTLGIVYLQKHIIVIGQIGSLHAMMYLGCNL